MLHIVNLFALSLAEVGHPAALVASALEQATSRSVLSAGEMVDTALRGAHVMPMLPMNLSLNSSCMVLISMAATRDTEEVLLLPDLVPDQCSIHVYDRSGANCSSLPSGAPMSCESLENLGHDQTHTWLYHIAKNYDQLADVLIFISSELTKHNRYAHLRNELEAAQFGQKPSSFCCIDRMSKSDGFPPKVEAWFAEGGELSQMFDVKDSCIDCIPSMHGNLREWLNHLLVRSEADKARLDQARMCFYSAFGTTSFNVRTRQHAVYENMLAAYNATASLCGPAERPADAWYVDWAAEAIFGPRRLDSAA
jgi:hypothetical protein